MTLNGHGVDNKTFIVWLPWSQTIKVNNMEIDKTQSPRKWKIEKVPRRLIKGHLRDEEF